MRNHLNRFAQRERRAHRELISGTIISDPVVIDFDGNGSGVWRARVDVGQNNFIEVPIKSQRGRNYAQLGQTVSLRRNAGGRFEVVGPGDRLAGEVEEQTYDLGTGTSTSTINIGFRFQRVPLREDLADPIGSFAYNTLTGVGPTGVIFGDGVTPLNLVRTLDAQGNPV